MEFVYFKAPNHEMTDFMGEMPNTCSLCGRITFCFELGGTICSEFNRAVLGTKFGCYECLKQGRFEFYHDAEAGFLDENGIHKFNDETEEKVIFVVDNKGNAIQEGVYKLSNETFTVTEEALIELRRTPNFHSWQESVWLVHCNDFMLYLGNWKPENFKENAPDGNGRKLFLEMTEFDSSNLELWPEDKMNPEWQSADYYAFKCRHCNLLRGYWDYD